MMTLQHPASPALMASIEVGQLMLQDLVVDLTTKWHAPSGDCRVEGSGPSPASSCPAWTCCCCCVLVHVTYAIWHSRQSSRQLGHWSNTVNLMESLRPLDTLNMKDPGGNELDVSRSSRQLFSIHLPG